MKQTLTFYPADTSSRLLIPLIEEVIKSGFPSPANDYVDIPIDLNKELIQHPGTTFFARVSGDSMIDAGIYEGDILVIDKSLQPQNGVIAVCFLDGEFTVKYIRMEDNLIWLLPANDNYQPIRVTPENDFLIWGIVTYSIRKHLIRKP